MKSIRDWANSQMLSNSLASSRPLSGSGSFFGDGPQNEESGDHATRSPDLPCTSEGNLDNQSHSSLQQVSAEDSLQSSDSTNDKRENPLAKIDNIQIKFLRLLQRLGEPQSSVLVAKVLYRIHLATLIRAGESDLKSVNHRNDRVRAIAAQQEASGQPELDFSIRILVLGKTGVGKSATINSVFDQTKTMTNAFRPATDCIQEVVGTVNGIKITFIDTPGLLPSSTSSTRRNRKIMLSVKRFIRKSPPDIVLFFERLDLINMGYGDFPLLKLVTEIFGTAVWFNTVLVMTHSSPAIPEGPNGYPVSYESHVTRCSELLQHYIHQAVSDSKIENPVLLVENHPQCKRNFAGETVLPNGQAWKSQFMLLCVCTKVLGDTNSLFQFQDSIQLGPLSSSRLPSLPRLLSSFLRHHPVLNPGGADNETDEILLSEIEEDDDYDRLPPIRILSKAQFERLSKTQKRAYLDELDYREMLYLKKQMKEESRRRRESKLAKEENLGGENPSDGQQEPEAILLPDMAVPPSFDSDCPANRYRCLLTSDQWLARPVLDPQGWDHDVGFDGVNLETAVEIKRNIFASITGQVSKDKQDFSIQSECSAAYIDPMGPTYSVGLDVQSAGKDLIFTARSNTKLRSFKCNFTDCGLSLASYGNSYFFGAKLEDTILAGKRLKFSASAGQMRGMGQAAYGGSFETTLRGGDYPVRKDNVSVSMTALSFNKETVLGGGFQSEFQPIRGTKLSLSGNLNSQKMGQFSVKVSTSEHVEVALIAVFTIFKSLLRRKGTENGRETLESG
ncbi:Avirulence inducedfamily protein [Tripterygium wilfordii]|uniref:Avirulence inducedfamily protein n=1 Tax=Tripterygium wilfordii TaxID=458696 RepID=A0A7J7BWC5_TRIWF|nr:translocase of chloroplast 90, chloroplastic [Tripterygium wilfordii]KAF5725846.1 Avirulence inducedfamily protein [Tripterygium wilfordii]